jgi:hypothetical protein
MCMSLVSGGSGDFYHCGNDKVLLLHSMYIYTQKYKMCTGMYKIKLEYIL